MVSLKNDVYSEHVVEADGDDCDSVTVCKLYIINNHLLAT